MLQRDSLSERHQSMVNRTSYRWQATQRMPITDTYTKRRKRLVVRRKPAPSIRSGYDAVVE